MADDSFSLPPRLLDVIEALDEHGQVQIDWPLVIVTIQTEAIGLEAARGLCTLTDELFELRAPFGFVFDLKGLASMPDAQTRRVLADYQTANAERFERYVKADASVINNPIARGLMTAIGWLASSNHPERVFGDRQEAIAWSRSLLDA